MPPEHNHTIDSITAYDTTTGELVWSTGTSGGYVWDTSSSFPNTAGVSIPEINELRNRIEELGKQLEEIKKRIGGGF